MSHHNNHDRYDRRGSPGWRSYSPGRGSPSYGRRDPIEYLYAPATGSMIVATRPAPGPALTGMAAAAAPPGVQMAAAPRIGSDEAAATAAAAGQVLRPRPDLLPGQPMPKRNMTGTWLVIGLVVLVVILLARRKR